MSKKHIVASCIVSGVEGRNCIAVTYLAVTAPIVSSTRLKRANRPLNSRGMANTLIQRLSVAQLR